MALKTRITDKAEFDKLPDVLKAEYKEENGVYLLQSDEAAELRTAKDRAVEEARIAKEERDRLKAEKDAAETARKKAEDDAKADAARKAGDVTALEQSWQAKLDSAVLEEKKRGDRFEAMLTDLLVDKEAFALAAEISTSPKLIMPHIKARMKAELTGDKPITRILDANGQPSAANLEDFKKELIANPDFAGIIRGSNASGGGANGNNSGGGATGKKISDMTEAERVAFHRADPAAFNAQKQAEGLARAAS